VCGCKYHDDDDKNYPQDDLKKMGGAADVPATFIAAQMRKFNSLKKQLLSIHARVNNSLLLKYEVDTEEQA